MRCSTRLMMLANVSPKNSALASSAVMGKPSSETASAVRRAAIGSLSTSTPSQSKITSRRGLLKVAPASEAELLFAFFGARQRVLLGVDHRQARRLVGVDLDPLLLVVRQLRLVEDGLDRALGDARAA